MNYILDEFVKDIKAQYNIYINDEKLNIVCRPILDDDDDDDEDYDNFNFSFHYLIGIGHSIINKHNINNGYCGHDFPDVICQFNNNKDYKIFKSELKKLKLIE